MYTSSFSNLLMIRNKKVQRAFSTTKRGFLSGWQAHTSQISLSLEPDMFTTSCGPISISKLINSNLGDRDSSQTTKQLKPSPAGEKWICHLSVSQGHLFQRPCPVCVKVYMCSSSPLTDPIICCFLLRFLSCPLPI